MDKFINTSNGGIPYVNNDHRWSDESIRDFLNKLLSDFGVTIADNDNFIISGVAVTHPSTWNVTEGYVWINNEILKVDAGTYATLTPPQEYRWVAVTTYDSTGNKTTRSGSSIQTYRKRRAVPTAYASTDVWTDDMMKFDLTAAMDRLDDKIAYVLNDLLRVATTSATGVIGLATAAEVQSGTLNNRAITPLGLRTQESWNSLSLLYTWNGDVYYKLLASGIIIFKGYIAVPASTGQIFANIPSGYKPITKYTNTIICTDGSTTTTNRSGLLTILTTGEARIENESSLTNGDRMSLDGIFYSIQ